MDTTLVEEQTNMLAGQELDVVSTTYKGRYAVRWDLVPNDLRPDYFQLIRTYTGINPDNQLTAGAGLTERAPGHPGVCFPNQMVVGIDDNDFSTRLGGRARLSTPGRIYRSVPGRPLDARSYAGPLHGWSPSERCAKAPLWRSQQRKLKNSSGRWRSTSLFRNRSDSVAP